MLKKIILLLTPFFVVSCTVDRDIDDLGGTDISNPEYENIHYWNFNNTNSNQSLISPTNGNGSLVYYGAYFDDINEGTTINVRNDDEAGSALRLRNPSGDFIMSLPTTGYENVVLTFAVTRTNNGPQQQSLTYTLDGENYTDAGLSNAFYGVTTEFLQRQFDFSSISGVDNNPHFKVKISFFTNADGESGNTRFDNITLDGIAIEGINPEDPEDPQDPQDPDALLFLYWNFNDTSSNQALISPVLGNGDLQYLGAYFDDVDEGSIINARNGDEAGSALRLRNPSGDFIIAAPTVNFEKVVFSYVTVRTNNGPQQQQVFYSLDGTNFTQAGISPNVYEVSTAFELHQYDFTAISGVNDNPNFKIKILFDVNADGDSGNSRFDNITFDGVPLNSDPNPDPDLTLLHYWNFNNPDNIQTLMMPSQGNAVLSYIDGVFDATSEGTLINAQNEDESGSALRLRNPMGELQISLPTTGYKDLIFKYATARTNTGAQQQHISYSTNGIDFISADISPQIIEVIQNYTLHAVDFSSVENANNNPNFKLKINFEVNAHGNSGSNRIDNITMEGYTL